VCNAACYRYCILCILSRDPTWFNISLYTESALSFSEKCATLQIEMRIYSLDLFYVAIIGRFYNAIDREGESMLDLEEYGTLRELHKQGLSISEIARSTGHSRGTVRKYLRADVPPEVKRRASKPSKLDGYKDYITQ
jgi:hypothetical protein